MKSTWFGDRKRYEIARLIQDADYSRHPWDLFSDFLVCASGSIRQATNKLYGSWDDDLEKEVIAAQERAKHPEKYAEAFGALTLALEADSYDCLGYLFQEWALNCKKWKGQCFTPRDVARCMARMQLADAQPTPGHRMTICEPACGAGAMLIAVYEVLRDAGFGPRDYFCWATDVDWKCAAMTHIQLSLLNIPCLVEWGNTITLETFKVYPTFAAALFPYFKPSEKREDEEPAEIAGKIEPAVTGQLELKFA